MSNRGSFQLAPDAFKEGNVHAAAVVAAGAAPLIDRRAGHDRRELTARSFVRGGLSPRRREGRRSTDSDSLPDWHAPHLMFLAIAILLLSAADAFLTLSLLERGAIEANPLIAYILEYHPQLFAGVKMFMTGFGVIVLVACSRARVFRVIRVKGLIHGFLLAYAVLVGYECWLLQSLV